MSDSFKRPMEQKPAVKKQNIEMGKENDFYDKNIYQNDKNKNFQLNYEKPNGILKSTTSASYSGIRQANQNSSSSSSSIKNVPNYRCDFCEKPSIPNLLLRFNCCELMKSCQKCATKMVDCPVDGKSRHLESVACNMCKSKLPTIRFRFECCDQIKMCPDCMPFISACPIH